MRRGPMETTDVPDEERETFGPQPLSGLRVVDLSRVLAGPLCTMILGDLGADVIKVERPATGDDTRSWGPPFVEGDAAYFLSLNRNKRSVELDLTSEEGAAAARELISETDIVIENFRSGVMEAMGTEHPNIVPYQVFRASDRPFVLAAGNDRLFARACEVLGRPELASDPRFATNGARVRARAELVPLLAEILATREAAHWLEALERAGVPSAPVRTLDEGCSPRCRP